MHQEATFNERKKKAYNWLSPLANILEQADGLGETE